MINGVKCQRPNTLDSLHLSMNPSAELPPRYVIKAIDGLGPVEAAITSSESAVDDGGDLLSSRVGTRNIVLTIGFSPEYATGQTVSDLRRDLYRYFMTKARVELIFESDDIEDVRIVGIVDKHDVAIFTKDPAVQISILCNDPYFSSLVETSVPLDVESLSPGVEVFYDGDIPTPYELDMIVGEGWTGLGLYSVHLSPIDGEPVVDSITTLPGAFVAPYDMPAGSKLILKTKKGVRGLYIDRGTGFLIERWQFTRVGAWMTLMSPKTPLIWTESTTNYQSVTVRYFKLYGGL